MLECVGVCRHDLPCGASTCGGGQGTERCGGGGSGSHRRGHHCPGAREARAVPGAAAVLRQGATRTKVQPPAHLGASQKLQDAIMCTIFVELRCTVELACAQQA